MSVDGDKISKHLSKMDFFRLQDLGSQMFFDVWAAEAIFGWQEISPYLDPQYRGLEIGAGPALLSAIIAKEIEQLIAIEPHSETFSMSRAVQERVTQSQIHNLDICQQSLNDFNDNTGFDFIWSINVFEHLDDWQSSLLKTHNLLRLGGRALILFPNYNIPYESHFGLPILFSKVFTGKVFKAKIAKYESEYLCSGLWDSLNFIKTSDVISFARDYELNIKIDRNITRRMFKRFSSDPQLAKRHKHLSAFIKLACRCGVPHIWSQLPASLQPYTALHLFADKK